MIKNLVPVLLFAVLGAEVAFGGALTDTVVQSEVRASRNGVGRNADKPVLILVRAQSGGEYLKWDYIAEIVKNRLRNFGIPSTVYEGNYADDLKIGRISRADIAELKLVLEITTTKKSPIVEYASDCSLSFIEQSRSGKGASISKIAWRRTQTIYGASLREVEDNLVEYIQKELKGFVPAYSAEESK